MGGKRRFSRLVVPTILALLMSLLPWGAIAWAAAITSASDTMSNITDSATSNHTVQFITPSGVAAGQSITITFPTGFALGSVDYTDMDLAEGATCSSLTDISLATGAVGLTWGATKTGQVVTIVSDTGTITATHCVQIQIGTNATYGVGGTHKITNQTVAQNNANQKILIGGTMADTGTIAVVIVANGAVAVTGQVDPQISCSIDTNSAAFGTFVLGTVTPASSTPTWTIGTNAANGYNLTIRSAGNTTNAGLYSAGASYVIKSADSSENATADLSIASTIGYGAQGTKTNGDAGSAATTVSAPYTSTTNTVGRLQLTDQTLASAAGPVSNATVTTTLKAKVTGLVPTGAYVDTLTYVCTGIF
ncbi:MAG TPA: hypothetical protein VMQ44_00555 [Candidatus Saccharimonadales bacterium]|nr:hypothetical protein [Candidatus Saccharimonadales bacterium]